MEPNPCPAAMDMTKLNGQNIVYVTLLAYVLELYCIFGCPWVRYERRHVDRGALLKLLTTLMSVLTKTRDIATYTVQLAALWLASHDMELMEGKLSPMKKMSYALNGFDMNMEDFTRDWKIDSPIPEYLCTSSLHELRVEDLHRLRELIRGGELLPTSTNKFPKTMQISHA